MVTVIGLQKEKKEIMSKLKNESKINEGRVVTNPKFRQLMKQAGLEDVMLVKDNGYFYIASDNDEIADLISKIENNSILIYSFNQQSPEEWIKDICDLLNQGRLNNIVKESIRSVLKENIMNNTIQFILFSPMNGQLNVNVPYNEFINCKNKTDLLWKYCAEQNDVQLMNNGYFKVHPKDPHKDEIENNYGF